jgi:hypothetical protein|nr:AAA family ATPase [Mobiluncus curtisii]
MVADLAAAREFAAQWAGKGYEKGECQKFWTLLLHDVLGYERMDSVLFEHRVSGGGFIDVWIRDACVMVEQKSLGVDLDAKIQQPATIVTLEPVRPVVEEINRLIAQANTQIDQRNTVASNQRSQKQLCTQQVWEHLAFDLGDTLNAYHSEKTSLESQIDDLKKEEAAADQRVRELEQEIKDLTKQTVNTAQTMTTINKLLHDSGFEGFKLREKPSTPNVYEVIRANGEIADRLSEGERNFITFLYFYFQLQGSLTNTGEIKNKIVIIDDPSPPWTQERYSSSQRSYANSSTSPSTTGAHPPAPADAITSNRSSS